VASPFVLPDGNVQIAFSGGRTSGYLLHEILKANGGLPDQVVVSFQNTGREMPQTLDFVKEVGARWGVNIVWLEYREKKPLFEIVTYETASRDGEPFEALIRKKSAIPNQQKKFCSVQLKTLTAKRYLVSIGWEKWTSAIGFRADEMHRKPFVDNRATNWTPLRDAGVSRHDVVRFWKTQPFDLRLPSVRGKTVGGNCDGCFLKSEAWLAALSRDFPERAAWWERRETDTDYQFSDRFSRAELRRYMDRQGDFALSTEGVLCQKDGGECQ
jgi:3'-phosphoadenosine 5'-phosphosulfate sulfotransferase (PAPS reductase)/FAD synthetase